MKSLMAEVQNPFIPAIIFLVAAAPRDLAEVVGEEPAMAVGCGGEEERE